MFTQDVRGVVRSGDVRKGNESPGNRGTYEVKGQHVVTLVQLGVDTGSAVDDRFIVAKDVALRTDRNSEVSECVAKVNDLLDAGTSS